MEQYFLFAVNLALIIATLTFLALMFISSCRTGGLVKKAISIILMAGCCGVFGYQVYGQARDLLMGKSLTPGIYDTSMYSFAGLFLVFFIWITFRFLDRVIANHSKG